MVKRTPRDRRTHEVDFTVPIDKNRIREMEKKDSCFGKAWDMGSRECPSCADKDICGIIYQGTLDEKAKSIEEKMGSRFLDTADFDALETMQVLQWIKSGETTTKELLQYVMDKAKIDDVPSVVEWVKNWIKRTDEVYTKEGKVWIR